MNTPKLKQRTIKLLRKVAAHILEEPKRLHMGDWAEVFTPDSILDDDAKRSPIPACNTQGCVAGWTILLKQPQVWKNMIQTVADRDYSETLHDIIGGNDDVRDRAAELLGISFDQADRLFYFKAWTESKSGLGWPKKFEVQYQKAKSPRGRANATVRRIEHFIATNGAE